MSSNQTCLVTGASRGIGRGIAEELGRHNETIIVNYRSSEAAAYDTARAIKDGGGTAIPLQADVSNRKEVEAMCDRIHELVGPVDVLVNNAGVTVDRTFSTMTREEWEHVIDVNLGGVFNCTSAFFDDIRESDDGRVINISSVVGQQGNYGQANYAATKRRPVRLHADDRTRTRSNGVNRELRCTRVRQDGHARGCARGSQTKNPAAYPARAVRRGRRYRRYRSLRCKRGFGVHDRSNSCCQRRYGVVALHSVRMADADKN